MSLKHIYLHGHGAAEPKSLTLLTVPKGAKVVIYAPQGAAITDGFAEKIYSSTDKYTDAAAWAKDWAGWKKSVTVVARTGTTGTAPALPVTYPDVTDHPFDLVLSGSGSLTHSGIYGKKFDIKDNLIRAIKADESFSLSQILAALDGMKLLDAETLVHWLACQSDHVDTTSKYSGWKVDVS